MTGRLSSVVVDQTCRSLGGPGLQFGSRVGAERGARSGDKLERCGAQRLPGGRSQVGMPAAGRQAIGSGEYSIHCPRLTAAAF